MQTTIAWASLPVGFTLGDPSAQSRCGAQCFVARAAGRRAVSGETGARRQVVLSGEDDNHRGLRSLLGPIPILLLFFHPCTEMKQIRDRVEFQRKLTRKLKFCTPSKIGRCPCKSSMKTESEASKKNCSKEERGKIQLIFPD